MQGGFKYKGAFSVKVPTYKPFEPPLTEDEKLLGSLDTQYSNLSKRLEAVGANQIADNRSLFEKMFNLPDEQGPLLDIIEIIERPMRGIQAGLMNLMGENKTGEGFWSGVWAGFSGNRRFTAVEFADEMGWVRQEDLSGTQSFLLNVGIDILMDPFTYFAPMKLAGKIFKRGGKQIIGNLDEPLKKIAAKMADDSIDFTKATAQQVIEYGKKLDEPIDIILDSDLDKLYDGAGSNPLFRYRTSADAPGKAYELALGDLEAELIAKHIEPGLDYMVLGDKTANRAADNIIARGITMADGSKVWVPVRRVEVKDLFTGAYGANKLGLELAEDGSKLTLQQGTEVMSRLTDELKDGLQRFLDDLTVQAKNGNQPLSEYIKDILEPGFKAKRELETTLRKGGGAAAEWLNKNVFARLTRLDEIFKPKYLGKLGVQADEMAEIISQFNLVGMGRLQPDSLVGKARQLYTDFIGNKEASDFLIRNKAFNDFVATQRQTIKGTSGSVGFNAKSLKDKFGLDEATVKEFTELLRDLAMGDQSGKWYSFYEKGPDGQDILRVIRGENLLPRLNITGNIRFSETGLVSPETLLKGERLELSTNIGAGKKLMKDPEFIKLLDDEMSLFMDSLIIRNAGEPVQMQLQLLQKLKTAKSPLVRSMAQVTDQTVNWFKYNFNFRAG